MFFMDLLGALFVALVLTGLFWAVVRRGPYDRDIARGFMLFFFLIVWFATWAVGAWITPLGPRFGMTRIVMFPIVGLIFAILVVATTPPEKRTGTGHLIGGTGDRAGAPPTSTPVIRTAWTAFFWIMIFAMVMALVARYAWM